MYLCQRQFAILVLPVSFVYRVVENRFIEVHGVLDDDANAPNMIIWDRIDDEAQGKDAN